MYRMLIQLSGRPGRYSASLLRLLFGMPWGPARLYRVPDRKRDEGATAARCLTRHDGEPVALAHDGSWYCLFVMGGRRTGRESSSADHEVSRGHEYLCLSRPRVCFEHRSSWRPGPRTSVVPRRKDARIGWTSTGIRRLYTYLRSLVRSGSPSRGIPE